MYPILKQILRTGIVTEPPPAPDPELLAVARRLDAAARRRFGHSLVIRQVDAGSCNACELEIHALNGPFYALEALGFRFTASPRHADLLLVTGPVTRHMAEALLRTYEAMPTPKLVVAAGDCAVCGGVFAGSYAVLGAADKLIPVDVTVPGCPPEPIRLLQGLITAVDEERPGAADIP